MSEGQKGTNLDSLLKSEIAECGRKMGLDAPEQDVLVEMTLRAWQQYGPRLVILDNVESEQVVRDWLPRLGDNVRVLLTSRRQQWSRTLNINTHRLDVLSPEESRQLLRDLAPHLKTFPDEELDEIGKKFGHLPLALDLAGRYMGDEVRAGITPSTYIERLEKQVNMLDHASLIGDDSEGSPTDHILNLNATFALSWEQLDDDKDALAQSVFLCAGYCAPNTPIPRELLQGAAGENFDDEDFEAALKRLYQTGLLQIEDGDITIHPLLAEYAQKVDEGERLEAVVSVITTLSYQTLDSRLPANFVPLHQHLERLSILTEEVGIEKTSTLWNNLGAYLNNIADYTGAKAAHERALRIDEATFGPNHPNVAIRLNNLGSVLKAQGDHAGAKVVYERALHINEAAFGRDHPNVAIHLNNLGEALLAQGDHKGAKVVYERALRIFKQHLGQNHPYVGILYNNLGGVLKTQGDYTGAKVAYERALQINEVAFGSDHPNVAILLNNLGMLLKEQGDYAGAKAAIERALHIDEAVFGPDHPNVAIRVNNLGEVLKAQGDYDAAKAAYERALRSGETTLGSHHPEVAIRINNLGGVLEAQGDYDAARAAYERALHIDEAVFGPDHPSVARDVNNLGGVLKAQGDYTEAKAAYERALCIDEATYGPDHPDVAINLNNLGSLLADMGDLDTGIQHLERALRIFVRVLPENHPNIQKVWENLLGYRVQKIMRDEGVSEEEAIEILKRQLGGE
ncbi:MAG: tetratricopeptide repeat protein [Chloroflexi bacterium]|nr:tetratricopeptide repeat protein [Chloroflexota bacterium]